MATGRLLVRVWTEERHRLLPGATVVLWTAKGHLPERVTDASGSVEVGDLDEGWGGARAVAAGHAMSDPKWATIAGDGTAAVMHFRLEPGVPVEGVVVSRETEAPVAGARVEAVRNPGMGRREAVFAVTTTDDSGRFRIEAVPRGGDPHDCVALVASCAGYCTTDVVVSAHADERDAVHVRVKLSPGGTVRGTVRDADGRPVPGARVEAHRGEPFHLLRGSVTWHTGPAGSTTLERPQRTQADDDGRFTFSGLERDAHYALVASAKGHAPATQSAVAVAPDDAQALALVLAPPGGLDLRIVAADGSPLEDADVRAYGTHRVFQPERAPGGIWRVRDIAETQVWVHTEAPRHQPRADLVELRPGRVVRRRIVLRPSRWISGTIVDDRGSPVAGASVWAEESDFVLGDPDAEECVRTDALGRFRVESLSGKTYRVVAQSALHPLTISRCIRPTAEDVRLILLRGVTLRMRLRPPSGKLARSRVLARYTSPDLESPYVVGSVRAASPRVRDGVVEVPALPAGPVSVTLLVPGFQRFHLDIAGEPGETVDLGERTLEPSLELSGRVVDSAGRPAAGVHVALEDDASPSSADLWKLRTTSGPDGDFRLGGLWAGRVPIEFGDESEGGHVEVDLPAAGPVTLRLEDRSRDPRNGPFLGQSPG